MKRITIALIGFVITLFSGMAILMKPTSFVSSSSLESDSNTTVRAVIPFGSALLVIGLFGLTLLGFIIIREEKAQEN